MIREMTDNERQRAEERKRMNTRSMADEIALYNAMVANKLTLEEAKKAMAMYADDKEFQKHLDDHYENGLVDDAEDMITPDY